MTTRPVVVAALLAVLVVSCADDAATTVSGDAATTAPEPTLGTASTPRPTTTTILAGGSAVAIDPGALTAGDPYFPELGNSGYDVDHYAVDLVADPATTSIAGSVTIDLTIDDDRDSLSFDLRGLRVAAVAVDGAPAAWERTAGKLLVDVGERTAGDRMSVTVAYEGTPETLTLLGPGFTIGWQPDGDGSFVASEPDATRTWLPSNDHPSDKATWEFRITVPGGFAAVANGDLISTESSYGVATWQWEMRQPMATYLATVVINRLQPVEYEPVDGVALTDWLPPDLAGDPPEGFGLTGEMIRFFSERFGPYPFDSYGHVVVGGLPAALETQTMSVMGAPVVNSPLLETVVAHELAHQWFGDWVTPATWQDVWLNEGFARFGEWLWLEHRFGTEALLEEVTGTHAALDGFAHAPNGDPGRAAMFGVAVYNRGGLTLHALRVELGDEAMFEVLRRFATRFGGGNASTADFVAVAEEVSGRDLEAFFDAWLNQYDLPVVADGLTR